jgi:Cohesin domain
VRDDDGDYEEARIMKLRSAIVLAAMVCFPTLAGAAVIQLLPANLNVAAGDTVSIDVVISGLGSSVVGDFDVDISFDPTKLSLTSYALGSALGDVAAADALDFSLGLVGSGLLNLAEVSLLSPAALDGLQTEPFALATILFKVTALALGTTTLIDVSIVHALGDGAGLPIAVSSVAGSTLTGSGPGVAPEPALTSLLLAGVALGLYRRRSVRR